MATFSEITALAERITKNAAKWYDENDVPAAFRSAHPLVLARAAILSGRDWQRCVADDDGSITVYNHQMWARGA